MLHRRFLAPVCFLSLFAGAANACPPPVCPPPAPQPPPPPGLLGINVYSDIVFGTKMPRDQVRVEKEFLIPLTDLTTYGSGSFALGLSQRFTSDPGKLPPIDAYVGIDWTLPDSSRPVQLRAKVPANKIRESLNGDPSDRRIDIYVPVKGPYSIGVGGQEIRGKWSGVLTITCGTLRFIAIDGDSPVASDCAESFDTATFSYSFSPSTSVPEPGSWAMLIIGFSAIGMALRQRQAAALPGQTGLASV